MTDVVRRAAPLPITIDGLAADHYEAVDGGGHLRSGSLLRPSGAASASVPPLVIVHGAMDRAAGFRRTIRHLPDRDVVAYDRRGYAGSVALAPADGLAAQADDLVRVLTRAVGFDGRRRLIVGHSAGGIIALHALARPEVADLAVGAVVYEAPLAWNDWYTSRGLGLLRLDPGDAAEAFLRAVIGDRLWDRLPAAMRAERRAEGPALLADMVNARRDDAAPDLAAITAPVLVGCGTTSSEHHRRSATELAAALPNATLEVLDGADHGVHLSSPTAFADLIASWPGR